MDYSYENLGDERFQEFCNCLISKEFSNLQSFPVGQPDGGRDSLTYLMDTEKKEFYVFQVKFVRTQTNASDTYKWLKDVIDKESPKINKLIEKGAIRYYLLTNLKGTAHLEAGSKDKINKLLEDSVKIPSICWWRDDLTVFFEKDPLFKWSFPEILNGQDILNNLVFENLNEHRERRENVIRAYLSDQYEMDNEVKFKQIDLHNKLFNLFTDVPLRIKKINEKDRQLRQTLHYFNEYMRRPITHDVNYMYEEKRIGTAEFLLHPKVQNEIERILLEGGPGQGKSTITQYICQVHRARLLNKYTDIELLSPQILNTPVRLPIKIDLRDLAAWIEKKNPYYGVITEDYFNNVWKNSLEAFITTHIYYHSKLEDFTSSDFVSVCKYSKILFVFDGFDEIANIKIRNEIIELINKGISRISVNTKSLQVIITSRPAAFSDSVGFSIDYYPHFELTDITNNIISEYVEKWIKASKISIRDANELRKLMEEKLKMPLLKDLTKSPMQLAIFISLLRTKGQSLPNKRTALYDSYIELIFDRESEKNNLVRDNRELLIDIHEYLAWILHSEAEQLKNSGSIQINELKIRINGYLEEQGRSSEVTDELFTVMRERVCALISRVQGTYEFEVQPLREYFCAKYLYKSAPHSSAGLIKLGTKPDRLHAILRNFYWQNVVRFFAGCADAGELDMIIQELKDLQDDELLKYTNYPRLITSQILSDYVFTQRPLKLKDVVKIIVDGINIGKIINQNTRSFATDPLLLPNECGREEVIKECFTQLTKFPKNEYAQELIGIINNNPYNIMDLWVDFANSLGSSQLTKWLKYGYHLRLIYQLDDKFLENVLLESDENQLLYRLEIVIDGNRLDVIDKNYVLKERAYEYICNGELSVLHKPNLQHSFCFLSLILHPYILYYIFDKSREVVSISFNDYLKRYIVTPYNSLELQQISDFNVVDSVDNKIKKFSDSCSTLYKLPINQFQTSLDLWDVLIENGRAVLGNTWNIYMAATVAAGIKSKNELYETFSTLEDDDVSLCKRVRCARMKSGNVKYWKEQFTNTKNKGFVLLVFFAWATPKTILELMPLTAKMVEKMKKKDLFALFTNLENSIHASVFTKSQQRVIKKYLDTFDVADEIKYLISLRFDDETKHGFIYNYITSESEVSKRIATIKLKYLVREFLTRPSDEILLQKVKKLYKHIPSYIDEQIMLPRLENALRIPYDVAKRIIIDCKDYPTILGSLAERSCRLFANEHLKPVGEIAKEKNWF